MNTTEFQALMNENLAQQGKSLDLTAIIPPGNIAAELNSYQARLFAATGDPALRYLDPVVPLYAAEPNEYPNRIETTGALRYSAPSTRLHHYPFGVLYFPATLIYKTGRCEDAVLVLGISTLSSAVLQPEIESLSQPKSQTSAEAHRSPSEARAGSWSFAVAKPVKLRLTWLWEHYEGAPDEKTISGTVHEPVGLQQHYGRL